MPNNKYNVSFRAPALPYPPQEYTPFQFEEFNNHDLQQLKMNNPKVLTSAGRIIYIHIFSLYIYPYIYNHM